MKAWTTLLTASLGMLAAGACTVTISDGEADDAFSDDDLGFDDQDDFDEDDFFDETETEPTDMTEPTDGTETDVPMETDDAGMPMETDMGETDMPMETDDGGAPMETDMEPEPDSGMSCEPPQVDLCEQCMAQDCNAAYTACACDSGCQMELDGMRACFIDKNFEENPPESSAEINECADLAVDGTLLGDLAACIEAPYMGPDDEMFRRFAGDGTCTQVCYGLFSVDIFGEEDAIDEMMMGD